MRQTVFLIKNWFRNGFDVFLQQEDPIRGHRLLAQPIQWTEITESPVNDDSGPTFSLRREEAQALMDALWEMGLRPSEGTGSAGALRQAEAHIDSLKTLATKLADIVAS